MKIQRPRGTNDLTPEKSPLWRFLHRGFLDTCDRFAYGQVDTPLFERSELFTRAVGEETDVVSKEMYTFEDRKGRSMSLRPEGTAGVARMVLENGMMRSGGSLRLGYWGPMFRYDRPQAGRYRQFHQFGVEALGGASPALDAEVITLLVEVLGHVGFQDTEVKLGSVGDECCRPAYLKNVLQPVLRSLGDRLCATCRGRAETNPMRVFDCKVDGCIEALADAPRPMDHLCESCMRHQSRVEELLTEAKIPFRRASALVRGLDYYTRTVFEVHYPSLGAQSALGGGGRYDRLIEQLGGPPTPAVGFSAGIERILLAVEAEKTVDPAELGSRGAYMVLLDDAGEAAAARVAASLREIIPVEVDYTGRGMKAQLKTSNARGVRFALILGEDELAKASVTVKDLDSGEQVTLPESELKEFIKALG